MLPKIIPVSHKSSQHLTVPNAGSFFARKFLLLLVHNSEFLENLIKNYCIGIYMLMHSRAEWLKVLSERLG